MDTVTEARMAITVTGRRHGRDHRNLSIEQRALDVPSDASSRIVYSPILCAPTRRWRMACRNYRVTGFPWWTKAGRVVEHREQTATCLWRNDSTPVHLMMSSDNLLILQGTCGLLTGRSA
jgi:IMP dehydrogenase